MLRFKIILPAIVPDACWSSEKFHHYGIARIVAFAVFRADHDRLPQQCQK